MTEIYQQNKKLIRTVVFIYFRNVPEYVASIQELFNIGFIGLVDAVRCYDVEKGNFRPYAVRRIRGSIQDYLERSWRHYGNGQRHIVKSYLPNRDRDEAGWILAECIGELPDRQQRLLFQHYFAEIPLKVLGRRSKRCEAAMAVQMKKIRQDLRARLEARGIHDAWNLTDQINESFEEGHNG